KNALFKSIQRIRELGPARIYAGHGESFFSQDNSLLQKGS
ncbi:MAG: hypothetical protein QG639_1124, partial [Patescibacteria group bacterium]|nr:hypothetical protein [Patescibacteria group bacterium]